MLVKGVKRHRRAVCYVLLLFFLLLFAKMVHHHWLLIPHKKTEKMMPAMPRQTFFSHHYAGINLVFAEYACYFFF